MGTAQISPPKTEKATVLKASEPPRLPWWRSTFSLAMLGQVLLWAAFPPLEWAPLAWLAPIPWIWLARQSQLGGRRPYGKLWLSSFLFHGALFYWVTLPHPATSIGLVALSFYLALYFPLFIGLTRVAVHRLNVSVILAAPVIWTGLELARAYLLTGFGMGSIAHTQYRWPLVVQLSDTFGGYGVSFLVLLVAACLARMLPCERGARAWWPVLPLGAALAISLAYGQWRLAEQTTEPGPKVALIQGSIDIDMKYDPSEAQRIADEYFGLSQRAVKEHPDLDLIVWPETMFRDPWFLCDPDFKPPADSQWKPAEAEAWSHNRVKHVADLLKAPVLLGIDTIHYKAEGFDHYNTALLIDRAGQPAGRYDKCHLVPFGEYVVFAETFPWLYKLTPLPSGTKAGSGPQAFDVGETRFAPSICYENTLSHFIRGQVSTLKAAGREPEVLLNLTNDGWFWGSTELDMHLACAVFRAIECRKPMLIAANTGFSAVIDSNGRIVAQGPRRATDVLVERVSIDRRSSPYLLLGDWPLGLCLLATVAVLLVGLGDRFSERKRAREARRSALATT